jgi:hypothetical protein
MKRLPFSLIVVGAVFPLAAVPATRASLVLHYTFDGNATIADGNTIVNVAGGTNGIFDLGTDAGNTAAIVPSGVAGGFGGNALRLTPANDGLGNAAAPNIATGYLVTNGLTGLISNQKAYTAMAWVNFGSVIGDNFIFGGSNPPSGSDQMLHHGSRNNFLHNAHWGDDIGPDQGDGPGFEQDTNMGTWHHVAYTNDGAAGNQSIYWDGVLVVGPGAAGFNGNLVASAELYIGTSFGSGSFSGILDEVRVYDTLLTQPEIVAAMTVVPEPATTSLAGLFCLGSLLLRRRRAAL